MTRVAGKAPKATTKQFTQHDINLGDAVVVNVGFATGIDSLSLTAFCSSDEFFPMLRVWNQETASATEDLIEWSVVPRLVGIEDLKLPK